MIESVQLRSNPQLRLLGMASTLVDGPREYYRTAGMTELVLKIAGALSYRKAVALFNRVRHEEIDPTPAAIVEREGTAMQAQMEDWTQAVLAARGFTTEGQPLAGTEVKGDYP